jgi:nitroimidazol reductase NimA-like FMN-containing flavoprotein (pyridoxamine 5'-phosphate oxidase superfamily)
MEKYHLRRSDKKIKNPEEIMAIIKRQEYLTLAMCRDNNPYLVTLNYGFHPARSCFYFHCANEGKKLDILKLNSRIYGQILENLKYKEGECSYAYRSVQFEGRVSWVTDTEEKKEALNLMVEKMEKPELIDLTKTKFLTSSAVQNVCIGKITVNEFIGKEEQL